jgi:hypothetical protein
MNEQLALTLVTLADKLDTTVEHLWQVMIDQAYISAMTNLTLGIMWILATIVATVFVFKKSKEPADEDGRKWSYGIELIVYVVVAYMVIASLVILMMIQNDIITALYNPEYWALQQLMSLAK